MANAQERFRAMMRDDVAPALRRLGFKGSGQAYTLPSSTHWAILGFQKSTTSDAGRVRFTANLTVVRKDVWAAEYGERLFIQKRPSPNTQAPVASTWYRRIGDLMPGNLDWWELAEDDNPEHVAGEVVASIEDYALPALHDRISATSDAS